MSEIIMPIEKMSGGGSNGSYIDETIFSSYDTFTKVNPYNNRFSLSSEVGGYKVVGNLVYVYMQIHPDKTKFGSGYDFWTINNDGELPSPKLNWIPLDTYDRTGTFYQSCIGRTAANPSFISLNGIAQNYTAGVPVTLKGVYEKA